MGVVQDCAGCCSLRPCRRCRRRVVRHVRDAHSPQFRSLSDWLGLVYMARSAHRLRCCVGVDSVTPAILAVAAAWLNRAAWDLYTIEIRLRQAAEHKSFELCPL